MRKQTPESGVLAAVCDYLAIRERQGKLVYWRSNNIPPMQRFPDGSMAFRRLPNHSKKGVPDINVVMNGDYIGLEVKPPKGKQSPEQKAFEQLVKSVSGEYHVVRGIDDLRELGL